MENEFMLLPSSMKNRMFTIIAFIIAFLSWSLHSSIHYFVYGEPQFEFFPDDVDEFLMRTVIVILIILFGIFADSFSRNMLVKQQQTEAARIYRSMLSATHHILNNLLHQMELFKMEALNSKDFDRDIIKLYDQVFNEASDLVDRLSHVENITEENIWASVDPKNIENLSNEVNLTDTKKHTND